jgi:hypothetical protein
MSLSSWSRTCVNWPSDTPSSEEECAKRVDLERGRNSLSERTSEEYQATRLEKSLLLLMLAVVHPLPKTVLQNS